MPRRLTEGMHRIPAAFTKDMMAWLDEMTREAKFSGGAALRITQILRALVRIGMWLDIDIKGVKDEKELFDRIQTAVIKKRKS